MQQNSTTRLTAAAPDAVGALAEHAANPSVVAALEVMRTAGVEVATLPGRTLLYRELYSPQGPQGAFVMGEGRTVEVEWLIDGSRDERAALPREVKRVRPKRNEALERIAGVFREAGWSVWRVESTNTATRRALRVGVTPPAVAAP